jgi:hypothetical protein
MARFLFASIPVPAHTTNALPFAARLVERGHEVVWYAGRAFHQRIAVGAIPIPYRVATDWGDPTDAFPQLRVKVRARSASRIYSSGRPSPGSLTCGLCCPPSGSTPCCTTA